MKSRNIAFFLAFFLLYLVYSQVKGISNDTSWSYLPVVINGEAPLPITPARVRVNIPYFDSPINTQREIGNMAILWFGKVETDANYSDVRIGYSDTELTVMFNIFDRRLWYNEAETGSSLEDWDAITLAIDLNGDNPPQLPGYQTYRFVAQLRHWQNGETYQAAYRGNNSGWLRQAVAFTVEAFPVALPVPNDSIDDRGWTATFHIPYTSLGLSHLPAESTLWRMSLAIHDRDSLQGPPLAPVNWPDQSNFLSPQTWGEIHFGLPAFTPPVLSNPTITTIRQGLNGALVPDAMIGGGTNCGEGLNYWTQWGVKNYAGITDNNIQNQINLGDWPCFTKYYLSFPLGSIPANQAIRSARLILNHFGGSRPEDANTSNIQVIIVSSAWDENTLTWNNAPGFVENVSQALVPVIPTGGSPANREWDVSRAVAQAYRNQKDLHIALYSADASMHSGKYFRSSEFRDSIYRPTLIIEWGSP